MALAATSHRCLPARRATPSTCSPSSLEAAACLEAWAAAGEAAGSACTSKWVLRRRVGHRHARPNPRGCPPCALPPSTHDAPSLKGMPPLLLAVACAVWRVRRNGWHAVRWHGRRLPRCGRGAVGGAGWGRRRVLPALLGRAHLDSPPLVRNALQAAWEAWEAVAVAAAVAVAGRLGVGARPPSPRTWRTGFALTPTVASHA
jgi:hypothetical protein